jgi:predicted negative regulator of RcsB-dependent stress response
MHLVPLFVAALALAPAPQAAPQAPPSPGTGSAKAAPAGRDVVWASSFEEAVAKAKEMPDGRILIEFTEPRCGECMRIEALVVPSTSFYSFTRDKVPVKVDRSTDDGRKLADRLGVNAMPAWAVVTPDLLLCGIQIGNTNQYGWITTFTRTEQSWAAYRKKLDDEKKDPSNEDLVFDIAQETFKRGGDKLAEPRFRKLATSASKPMLKEESLAYLASIELDSNRVDEAARDLDTLLAIGKDAELHEKAQLRRADVDIARGRGDLALKRLAAFKKEHPGSPRVKEVDAILAALKQHGYAEN